MERSQPLVTVGMPVYNGAPHLAGALESVLAQDHRNLEVLVCDNASEDSTASIAADFAARDGRVRYVRNEANIGLLPNFRRVRDLAQGEYFTWLGHDDLLSSPSYLSTVVGYLAVHPDAALCHTDIRLLKPDGTSQVVRFPELHPDRPWSLARRDLFDWPQKWLEMCSHGVFRRSELVRLPMPDRTRTGRPSVFCWEIGILTELACRSRIVVLPEALRSYRSSERSAARLLGRDVSPLDLWLLDLETKLALVRRAAGVPASPAERLRLLGVALRNLPKPTFRRRFDYRFAGRLAEREVGMLLRAASERRLLLERLEAEVVERRRIFPGSEASMSGADTAPAPSFEPELRAARVLAAEPAGNPIARFVRPPSAEVVSRYAELGEVASELLDHCQRLLGLVRNAETRAAEILAAGEQAASD